MENTDKKITEAADDKTVTYTEAEAVNNNKAKSSTDTDKKAEEKAEKSESSKVDSKPESSDTKEEIDDVDIIDINKADKEDKADNSTNKSDEKVAANKKKAPKTTSDFIAKQKKRKRRRRIITWLIVIGVIVFIVLYVRAKIKAAAEMLAELSKQQVQTAFVEKKTLYDSKDATGTLYALEARTLTANLGTHVATIDAVNVEVGDIVTEGDVLVAFSTENIEKDIERAKEDINEQRQLEAINEADAQRDYVNAYNDAVAALEKASKQVERTLQALHEACDGYGQAKRARDEYIEKNGRDDNDPGLISLESRVASALAQQEQCQRNYDDAVEAQAQAIADVQTKSLSKADSAYQQQQITSGDKTKQYERNLETYEDSLEEYIVTASMSGVVTEVNVSEGNKFSNGSVLTIQDMSGYKAEVLVDEYDIPKVKKAYDEAKAAGRELEVVVKTDATGDKEFKGHVTLIAPTSTSTVTGGAASTTNSATAAAATSTSSGTANYKVSIEIDDDCSELMVGMSAKVAIVVDQSPADALCVPYNCVEEKEDGTFVVRVMDENGDKSVYGDEEVVGDDSSQTTSNGIVVENNTQKKDKDAKDKAKDAKAALADAGPRYREVVVNKIFDTDYYAAIVPVNPSELKEGDEVMVISEKADGNDLMRMFGGPDGM